MQPRVRNIAKAVGTTYSVQAGSSQHTPAHCTSVAPVAIINALDVFGSNQDVAFRDCTFACIAAAGAFFLAGCRGCFASASEAVPEALAKCQPTLRKFFSDCAQPISNNVHP
jgi:hypothetical protein